MGGASAFPKSPIALPFQRTRYDFLSLTTEGYIDCAIASCLYLSPKIVRNDVSSNFTKLEVSDRSQAIVHTRGAGLGTRGGSSTS